ncbi:MAG: valine--tRNA ligase [Candidatus Eremiobacteraeota bacterium]|nr:valine--tRNA ligase [Candidatus Eremiobacteraeota bacterium]
MTLPKTYDPHAVEQRLYEGWEKAGFFHEEPDVSRPPFIIPMPPPNVTARAHIGHASTYAPMDALVRYHRMLGDNADWLPGTDHAAIATEAVLVKQLAQQGTPRESIGRQRYLELAWQWSQETGATIFQQFRRLGFGADWERSRFTMETALSKAVVKVFVALFREGLIYRGTRLVNWDPKAQSTISDAEIEHVERDTFLWRVKYPLPDDSGDGIEIATTRPETILADVAIAVHPQDERYAHLVGKSVLVPPLLRHAIPIIADTVVDSSFGTGAVKVTPAHDATDYDIGERHNLSKPSVIGLDGRITNSEVDVGRFAGMDRFTARTELVADLKQLNLLCEQTPYRHSIATSDRTGEIVEPLLSLQWFCRMKPLAEPALQAYRDGKLRFVPERYGRTYEQWLENIRDWNISRQLWWGHQLPVWYTPGGDVIVAETEEEARDIARAQYTTDELRRDPDTLDTWFSSGLWPFTILGWPQETPELKHWYPAAVLITGWEIIFLWVARMVMLGLKFMGTLPFSEVFIAPLLFDAQGRKMSKSLGNSIDPLVLIEKYGADALRMGTMRQMRLEGQEVRFQESRCEESRNFNNKIWNATRYILALPEGLPRATDLPPHQQLNLADKWILTRLRTTIETVSNGLDAYDFGTVAETLWKFIWYEFCDWYLEATKEQSHSRAAVLSYVMNGAMRLLHPIQPFITEEVWLALPHDGVTILTASWPDPLEVPSFPEETAQFESLRRTVERIRTLRAEMEIAPRVKITLHVPRTVPRDASRLLGLFTYGTPIEAAGSYQSFDEALSNVTAQAPLEVLQQRYVRRHQELLREVERSETKLSNEGFVNKAAPQTVAKERDKLQNYRNELARVIAALDEMGAKT